jgi:phage/plasmid-associated DNA primase
MVVCISFPSSNENNAKYVEIVCYRFFDALSGVIQVSAINRKGIVYVSSDGSAVLALLTHLHMGDVKHALDNIAVTSGCPMMEVVQIHSIAVSSWNIIAVFPSSEKHTLETYVAPYELSITDATDPLTTYQAFEEVSSRATIPSDDHSIVAIPQSTWVTNHLILLVMQLSRAPIDEWVMRCLSILRCIALDNSDQSLIASLDGCFPDISPQVGTLVDIYHSMRTSRAPMYSSITSGIVSSALNIIMQSPRDAYDAIAAVLALDLASTVVCSDASTKTLYVFTDRWRKVGSSWLDRYLLLDVQNKIQPIDKESAKLASIIRRCVLSPRTRDALCRSILVRLESKRFEELLDSKTNIIGVSNGVYDLEQGAFRRERPTDYVLTHTLASYPDDSTYESGLDDLLLILRRVFTSDDMLIFWLTSVSLAFSGYNREKVVTIWIGRTDTSKSTCQRLIEAVFGDYSGVLPTSVLTDKRPPSHGTTSAVSSMCDKRIVFLQEPEDLTINSSQIKLLSGNDRQYTREIYEKAKYMHNRAMMIVVSNGSLDFTRCDSAALSRILVIPFTSVFITARVRSKYNVRSNGVNIFDADPDFDEKIPRMAPLLLRLLTDVFKEYLTDGFHIPPEIRTATDNYILRCNPLMYFLDNNVVVDESCCSSTYMLYEQYKDWARRVSPSRALPSMQRFVDDLRSNGWEESGGVIYGLRIKDAA